MSLQDRFEKLNAGKLYNISGNDSHMPVEFEIDDSCNISVPVKLENILMNKLDSANRLDTELLGLENYFEDSDVDAVVVHSSGDIFLQKPSSTIKDLRILEEKELSALSRNVLKLRGLNNDSSVKSLYFRYKDYFISAIFSDRASCRHSFVIKRVQTELPSILPHIVSVLALLKLNLLIVGGLNSFKSNIIEKLLKGYFAGFSNKSAVLLQSSPIICTSQTGLTVIDTEFFAGISEFKNVFNNVLRMRPDSIFVDTIQDEFMPYFLKNLGSSNIYSRVSYRASSLEDCVESLSTIYAKEYNVSLDLAELQIFSKFKLVLDLSLFDDEGNPIPKLYFVNSTKELTFEELDVLNLDDFQNQFKTQVV